ncbi:MAG TPA: hypothetical protein VF461_01170 [Gemmatimonadaceae bacterium]
MTTLRSRSLVSLAAAFTLTLALGACAGNTTRSALNDPAPIAARPATIKFDNEARQYVHVYLVGENRQWLLGRVEPGGHTALRVPVEAMTDDTWFMRLAVLAGDHVTLQVASKPGVQVTLAQPTGQLLAQKWTFSQTMANGQATASLMGRAQ